MPSALPTISASAIGVLNTRAEPNRRCSPTVALNTPPFPFTMIQVLFIAAIGNVFAKHDNPLVARHFVSQRGGNHLHHGPGFAGKMRRGFELGRSGIDIRGVLG